MYSVPRVVPSGVGNRKQLFMNTPRYSSFLGRNLVAFSTMMIIGSSPTFGQNGAVAIAYPAKSITVDGDLSDWPEGLRTYPIERIETGDKLVGEDDLRARFRLAFNPSERALYVAVEVRDDSVVPDAPGEVSWNAQDSCELFIDPVHAVGGATLSQYARYGNRDRVTGPAGISEKSMKVAVTRTDHRIIYEWRIEITEKLDPGRVIGFDVSVADKDKDGSFSWAAWGSGTQKLAARNRCGEFLLVTADTKFGEVSGVVAWKDTSPSALPSRVRIQSTHSTALWRGATVDSTGAYKAANLPAGHYSIYPVDSADVRVEEESHVDIEIEADRSTKAEVLLITPIPWPGLIGAEGVLKSSGDLDAGALDRFVRAYLDYYKIPGISVAVIKDSKVVYHRGFGVKSTATKEPVTADTVFEAASMTKPVFAYTVLRLLDRGVLNLDIPLYTYLPYEDIAYDDRYKLITARMVLTHRTGFPNWRDKKLDIKFTPGTKVSYSGEGFVYLGKVVEKLTGKKLVDLCREEVLTPLGIAHASLVWNDDVERLTATPHAGTSPGTKWKPSEPNMAASLNVDAGNYARFLTAVLQGKGLAASTAKEMLRPQVDVPDQKNQSWGLGIAIEETPSGTSYGHGGSNTGFTSRSVMYKDQGFGYVFLVNNGDAFKIDNVLNAYLIAGKSGLKATQVIAHKLVKVEPRLYDAYLGRYEIRPDVILTITREGDHLMAQATGDGKSEIFPESETVFFLNPATDATVTFVKDDKGKVAHIIAHREGSDTRAKRLEDAQKADAVK
jgi:CubicO group peptidase (beta-lactamase class C family)